MWRGVIPILAALAWPSVGAAEPAPKSAEQSPSRTVALERATLVRLQNGLQLVMQRDRRQPLVAVLVGYGVGHRDDPPGYEGLAHLVEHMTYQGSRHLTPYRIVSELEAAGALSFNGLVDADATRYHALLPAGRIATPFWLESERMGFTLERFDEKGLAHERTVVKKEMLQRRPSRFELEIKRALFPGDHPYRWTLRESAVPSVRLSEAQWFFQRYYRPDNASVIVVGDFEPSVVRALAEKYFGPIPNPSGTLERPKAPVREFLVRERLIVTERWVPRREVVMIWPGPPPNSPEGYSFGVLVGLLRTGAASLRTYLVEHLKLAREVRIRQDAYQGQSLCFVQIELEKKALPNVVEGAVEAYLASFRGRTLLDTDIRRVRERYKKSVLGDLQDPLEHAQTHLRHLQVSGVPFDVSEYFAHLDALDPARLGAVLKRSFDPTRRVSAWHMPPGEGEVVPPEGEVSHEVDQ